MSVFNYSKFTIMWDKKPKSTRDRSGSPVQRPTPQKKRNPGDLIIVGPDLAKASWVEDSGVRVGKNFTMATSQRHGVMPRGYQTRHDIKTNDRKSGVFMMQNLATPGNGSNYPS